MFVLLGHRDRVHRAVVHFGQLHLRGDRVQIRGLFERSNEANSLGHFSDGCRMLGLAGTYLSSPHSVLLRYVFKDVTISTLDTVGAT